VKKDIVNRADIELLVNRFYERVKADPLIGKFFTELYLVDWNHHLPVMYSFWENALFFTGGYTGNPMEIHRRLHQVLHLNQADFMRWNMLFTSTVDELFKGEKAELAKQRALSISQVMQIKILSVSGEKMN
jgi:hemoglobin